MIENFYIPERTYIVLLENEYQGVKYRIVSYGTHPCAYVELPEGCSGVNIECHGGVTYTQENTIGWDYNHFGDYYGGNNNSFFYSGKRWTTLEIYEEVKKVIDQILCYGQ